MARLRPIDERSVRTSDASRRHVRARVAELESAGDVIVIQRAVVTHASNEQLVAMGWDLGDLARRYRRFVEMFAPLDDALTRSVKPAGERPSCCERCSCTNIADSPA